jgi:hypothetical protein
MTQPNNIHHLRLNLPQDRMPEHVIVTMRFSPIVRLSTLLVRGTGRAFRSLAEQAFLSPHTSQRRRNLTMKTLSRHLIPVTAAVAAFVGGSASAQTLYSVTGVPTNWQIQNYVPNNVVVYYTGSSCVNGALSLPSTAVQADMDRLWALMLTAKATGQQVTIYYTVSGSDCLIASFLLIT